MNYTAETLAHFREQDAESEFFFLLGADMFRDLPHWRHPERICDWRCRGRSPFRPAGLDFSLMAGIASPERIEAMRQHEIECREIGLSPPTSVVAWPPGQSIRYRTPRAVERYVEAQKLYR